MKWVWIFLLILLLILIAVIILYREPRVIEAARVSELIVVEPIEEERVGAVHEQEMIPVESRESSTRSCYSHLDCGEYGICDDGNCEMLADMAQLNSEEYLIENLKGDDVSNGEVS